MKRAISGLLALALSAVLVMFFVSKQTKSAVHAQDGCSQATVTGNYGFTFSGFNVSHNKLVPFYGAGTAHFDGAGNFAATFASSFGGVSSTGNTYTATYSVHSNCAISIHSTDQGDNFIGVIVGDGAEILSTDISNPDTINLNFKKQ